MALIACTECGREISTSASACPGCGAPAKNLKQKKARPIFKILGGLLLLLIAVAAFSPKEILVEAAASAGGQPSIPIAPTTPPMEIYASQLDADYHANEVSADMKYKARLLRVKGGVVVSINKNISDDVWLGLWAKNEFMPIHATGFSPNQVSQLTKGDSITITCTGDGMMIGSPMLKNCSL